ncbi:MAG: class I SAM-dependent methyltransferase [Desulfobulbaceae bacterium]|nr:class I SAM-dependent methyltransferase [Desulfobulbaceae bacterium]HIJ90638.1 class I SAM-dependent methyltransferase [Deltaproteobacteria bacterium]
MEKDIRADRIYGHARYTALYDLELGDFREDLPFYRKHLPKHPCTILELGCGTGRVSQALAADGHHLTGIDLSFPMLAAASLAARTSTPHYACMDMTSLAFRTTFAAIIAPYNTLNLLTDPKDLRACLSQVRHLLAEDGVLLLQLYIPDQELRELDGKKRFQFQLFNCPDGSTLIKEILKNTMPQSCLVEITERYRLRFRKDQANEDWEYTYQILGYGFEQWREIFADQGFYLEQAYGDFAFAPFVPSRHTTLLLVARKGSGSPK